MNRSYTTIFLIAVLFVSILAIGCKKAPEPEPVPPTPVPTFTPVPEPEPEPTKSPEEIRLEKLNEAREFLKDNIYFDYDRAYLSDEAKASLAKKAEYLINNSDIRITIEGHCDERGSNEYNLGLGERRAAAAKKYLVTYGVGESLVDIITFGEEKPVCFEHNDSCWGQNRRAFFVVHD